jgi:hypothetical protein
MPTYTAAQKRAYAIKMSKARNNKKKTIKGKGAYYTKTYKKPYRPRKYISGKGDYATQGGEIGQSLGRGLGGLADLFISGKGDYQVKTNSLMGGIYLPAAMHGDGRQLTRVKHREYITDINAASAFTVQSFPINPGQIGTFPWLSQMAEAFEEYRIDGMIFEFKTLSADYTTAASAALGYVIMATEYNSTLPNFADKHVMNNYFFSNDGKPSESFCHPIECARNLNPLSELYVRTGSVPSGSDQRFYDLGNFQIATGGNTGTGVVGELWCVYDIVFMKPKLIDSLGLQLLTDHYSLVATNLQGSAPLGLTTPGQKPNAGSNLGTNIDPTGKILTFPPNLADGTYLVEYLCKGTSAATTAPVVSGTNISFAQVWEGDTLTSVSNGGQTVTTYFQSFVGVISGPGALLTWGGAGGLPTSPTSADLWITQINGGIVT